MLQSSAQAFTAGISVRSGLPECPSVDLDKMAPN